MPETDALLWCIGPPLKASFARLLGDEARAQDAVALYRERFTDTGLYENDLYAGIPETLQALHAAGKRLFVATSKPHVYASRIVGHFGIADHFERVFGSELDGTRVDKTELLAYALAETGTEPKDAVMIGDREHDILGARANNVATVAVTWGYGAPDELTAAKPDATCDAPDELPVMLRGLLDQAQDSLIDPEDDDISDTDCREEGVRTSVIAGMDASPVLEFSEHVLDLVAAAVEFSVEGRRVLPVGFWRYAGGDTALDEGLAEPVRVIALVAQQRFALGKRVNHERGPLVVAHLSFAEQQDDRATLTVTDGMKLGVQASLGASDTAGNSPFFRRLAAVRCALRWVASIITWSARAAKIRLNTPRRLHRMKRL